MRIRYAGKMWDVRLCDDGTMDTVISVSPSAKRYDELPSQEVRFDAEYASMYRRSNGEMTLRGLRILGQEAAEQYEHVGFDD